MVATNGIQIESLKSGGSTKSRRLSQGIKSMTSFPEDNHIQCEIVGFRQNIAKKLESVKGVTDKYISHRLREWKCNSALEREH